MSQSPIAKVLFTLKKRRVRALLMGGQACILYGAAEFSRDVDVAVAVSNENLDALRLALADLKAEQVYLPSLSKEVLLRGHACHYRCHAVGVDGLRVDIMGVMRGVDSFAELWGRRQSLRLPSAGQVSVMSVPDLVRAKKTQRDKDWPMIRRLVEVDVLRYRGRVPSGSPRFWLQECRTPDLLIDLVEEYAPLARQVGKVRPAVHAALKGNRGIVVRFLRSEEEYEREADRRYWAPLRAELAEWRMNRPHSER